jgi:hypothetical protein
VDPLIFPRTEVIYRFEALGQDGLLAATATKVGDGFRVFPGQILLIFILALAAYVTWFIGQQLINEQSPRKLDWA